jgi:D-glycero-D-manno-heptose 1,7-bisphosphate phosphatase
VDHLHRIEDFKLRPNVGEAIRQLNGAGFWVFVITNQPMIAKGLLTIEGLEQIHHRMVDELSHLGACIDSIQFCPHSPGGIIEPWNLDCGCRKPKAGMIEKLCQAFPIDLKRSFVAGDTWRDVQLAQSLNLFNYGVTGGAGFPYPPDHPQHAVKPNLIVDSLLMAVNHRLSSSQV